MHRIFNFTRGRNIIPQNLKTKLILSVLLLLVLFAGFFLINNVVLNSIIIKNTNQSVLNTIKQANISLSYVLEQAKEQAYQLSAQVTERSDIERLISRENPILTQYEEYNITTQYIAELAKIGLISKLETIYVFSPLRKKLITSNNGVFQYNEISGYEWLEQALSIGSDTAMIWVGNCHYLNKQQWDPHSYIISLICKAHKINRNIWSEVYFGLNFNESTIYNILRDISITPGSVVYLADQNGIVISAKDKKIIGLQLNEAIKADIFSGNDAAVGRIAIKRDYFQRIVVNNSATNWRIIALIPEKELFAERWLFWLAVVFALVFVSGCAIFIAYRTIVEYVDRPVVKLVDMMKMVEMGNFKVSIREQRKDEFGALYTGFNEMVGKIDVLIRELYQEKLIKRDIELKYLQKLINPHFLYNTLDTIRWLAMENRLSDASAMTLALSNLYRMFFNRGQDFTVLEQSLLNIENYLYIHKVRYGGAFSYHIDITEEAKGYLILNLIVQPAVENAVIHGIQRREEEGGFVKITARKINNLICIRVFDNGIGMRREKMKIIKANMKSDIKASESGLKIVHQKIRLFYGEKYGIRIRSAYGRGTCISIIFPAYEYLD